MTAFRAFRSGLKSQPAHFEPEPVLHGPNGDGELVEKRRAEDQPAHGADPALHEQRRPVKEHRAE